MHRPDIVLADYHLDGETGLDVIAQTAAIHGGDLPAVLVTADRSTEVRAGCRPARRSGDQQAAEAGGAAHDDGQGKAAGISSGVSQRAGRPRLAI